MNHKNPSLYRGGTRRPGCTRLEHFGFTAGLRQRGGAEGDNKVRDRAGGGGGGVEAGESADGNSGGEAGVRRHLRPPPTSHRGGQQKLLSRVYRPAPPSLPLSPQSPVTEFSRLNALPPRPQLPARGKISRDFAVCRSGASVASLAPPSKNPETRRSENRTRHRASKLAPQEPPPVLHPPLATQPPIIPSPPPPPPPPPAAGCSSLDVSVPGENISHRMNY